MEKYSSQSKHCHGYNSIRIVDPATGQLECSGIDVKQRMTTKNRDKEDAQEVTNSMCQYEYTHCSLYNRNHSLNEIHAVMQLRKGFPKNHQLSKRFMKT